MIATRPRLAPDYDGGMADAPEPEPDYIGHRSRVRDRLLTDPNGLQDYELIEYLLSLVIPRIDTKPLAKALLREFDGFAGLFAADTDALRRVKGLGDRSIAALRIASATAVRLAQAEIESKPVLANWQALLDYLRAAMAAAPVEQVRVLHLNTRNMLIRDELMAEGSIDQAPVYIREIAKRAMELGSAAVILVHNHPSGDPTPSRADIDITRQVVGALKPLGITVHDHIVMGANSHASLKSQGLM